MEKFLSCVDCSAKACDEKGKKHPNFCVSQSIDKDKCEQSRQKYLELENNQIMCASAGVEYENYCSMTRVQETVEWAKKMKVQKIGIATCVGLLHESRMLAKILRHNGFEVFGASCKVGEILKSDINLDDEYMEIGENTCNPVLQAEWLEEKGSEINIVMGLCVGHDSMFYKYSKVPTTTLVTKDRVLGHNPVMALYTADTYYKEKLFK
ncbi:MAG: DUF1847 domain-containing protein [Clostridia bacterium]